MNVWQLALKIILYIVVGFAARKIRVMQDGFDKLLTRFVMAIPLPCMIINSFLGFEFSFEELTTFPVIIGLAVLLVAVCFLFGHIIYIRMGRTGVAKSVRFALTFTNFTFFGFAVVSELYGAHGMLYYVVFTLPIRFAFYGGAALTLGDGSMRMGRKELLKKFFCEPVVAVIIGFVLYLIQIPIPGVIADVMETFGNMASPLGLILVGAIIADAKWSGALKYHCVIWVTLLRLFVMPAIALGISLLLGIDHEIIRTIVFYFAMPVASLTPAFILRYNPHEVEGRLSAGYMVVVSTVVCVATIPMWAAILEKI